MRRRGTPPGPTNASIPRGSGAPPPRHSQCPGGPLARSDPARAGRGGARRRAPRDAAAGAHRKSRISWSLLHRPPIWAARLRGYAILRVAAPLLTKAAHRSGRRRPEEKIAAPHYSMTSFARARIDGGTVRPSAFAVFRLTTNSNRVGCWTGRSAGLVPFRILST